MKASQIPHPDFFRQLAAPQPSLLLLFVFAMIPLQGLSALSSLLMTWPLFVKTVQPHFTLYQIAFALTQLAATSSAALYLAFRYKDSLGLPPWGWRTLAIFPLLLPLLLDHASKAFRMILLLPDLLLPQAEEALHEIHVRIWSALAYGPSANGVLLSSFFSFVAPIFEELIFSYFLLNIIARKTGWIAALPLTAALFALAHGFQFGLGPQLFPLFFSGLAFAAIRVLSGSVWYSIAAHTLVNFLIYLPKWMITLTLIFGHRHPFSTL